MPDHRIAHILRWPTVAGTEIATLRLAQCFPRDDFEHVAFPAHHPSSISQLFSAHGFEVIPYVPSEQSLRWRVPFLLATGRLARSLRQARVDLVHCSDVMAGFDATLAARLLRLPVICHVRHPHNHIPRRHWPALRLVFVVSTFESLRGREQPTGERVIHPVCAALDGRGCTRVWRLRSCHQGTGQKVMEVLSQVSPLLLSRGPVCIYVRIPLHPSTRR